MRSLIRHLAFAVAAATAAADDSPELIQDGDLVVLLGGTLVERAQESGAWEIALQLAYPDRTFSVRNFGWSGDTVWAESRGQFDPPSEGYRRMIDQITALKPDVILIGYGNAEAFAGEAGLPAFTRQYRELIDDLPDARLAHLLPLVPLSYVADDQPGFRGPPQYRDDVARYADVIRAIAKERGELAIEPLPHAPRLELGFEDNGMHLNGLGYVSSSMSLLRSLDRFSPETFAKVQDPDAELLLAVRRKNRLVFDRWRPQNVTYLFGFRKHEQGQNAAEIPQFDPLIEAADAEIGRIKRELGGTAE